MKSLDRVLEMTRAEGDASRRSAAEWRELLEHLPAGAYMCDADGLITYFNQSAVRMWGRTPHLNDPRDRYCGSVRLYSAPDGEPIDHSECWMALALKQNKSFSGREILVERPDGDRITVLAHASPFHNERGDVIGAVNVLVDISERKEYEDSLRAADKQKDQFLAVLAHELRNPLAPMRLAVEMLQRNVAPDPAATLGVIDRQIGVLTRLVDDLMDVARITRDNLVLKREHIPLAPVLRTALEISLPLLEAAGHRLEVDIPASTAFVNGDAARLTQVFANLLNNAAKYTPLGGRVTFAARFGRDSAEICVRDTGVGISAEMLPRVFEMFTQADRSKTGSQAGLGVGLALVKELVDRHGGSVRALSKGIGCGSEFVVTLPLIPAPAITGDATLPASATTSDRESRRILVVDDNRDAADGLAMLFRLRGDDVRTAYDGPDALQCAHDFQPEVVVLDIGLPGMDGYETARRLRAEPWAASTIIIALTGWSHEKDKHDATAAGFDHYFVKPAQPAELENCWKRLRRERSKTPAHNQRILVVDDHPHVADSIASVLRYLGADVGTAYDGPTALATLKEFKPSIMFIDLAMPGMSGYDVVREVRAMPEFRELSVIAVSGYGDSRHSEEMRNAGFDHSLTKPTDINTLEDMLALVAR